MPAAKLGAAARAGRWPTDGCPVTVYPHDGGHHEKGRRCGEPIDRDGLCTVHVAERERLS